MHKADGALYGASISTCSTKRSIDWPRRGKGLVHKADGALYRASSLRPGSMVSINRVLVLIELATQRRCYHLLWTDMWMIVVHSFLYLRRGRKGYIRTGVLSILWTGQVS